MGGYDGGANVLATVEAYNPRAKTWRSYPSMVQRRSAAVAEVVGGRLVVAGGYGGFDVGPLTSVEAYSPTGSNPLPPLPHAACNATACVLNGRLYVIGGQDRNTVQVLEMTENGWSWSCKANLPAVRCGAASVVHDGKIWVMGGAVDFQPSASISIYDAEGDTWEAGPPLRSPCNNCRAATVDGDIFLLHQEAALMYGAETQHGRGWRVTGVGGAADFMFPVCESLLLG